MKLALPPPRRRAAALPCLIATLLVVTLGGCQRDPSPARLMIFAAASTTDVMRTLTLRWEEAGHARPQLALDASSRLARQVIAGAPADIYISADRQWMNVVEAAGALLPGTRKVLAGNTLVLAVPQEREAPADIQALAKMPGRIGLPNEEVPAGRYADAAIASAGLTKVLAPRLVRGGTVRRVLEWVAREDLPASFVFRTDTLREPRVKIAFALPPEGHPPIVTVGAVVARSGHTPTLRAEARAFVAFCGGAKGRQIFQEAGFAPPPQPLPTTPPDREEAQP